MEEGGISKVEPSVSACGSVYRLRGWDEVKPFIFESAIYLRQGATLCTNVCYQREKIDAVCV